MDKEFASHGCEPHQDRASSSVKASKVGAMRLRVRLVLAIAALVSLTVLALSTYFIVSQTRALETAMHSKSAVMRAELEHKGLALARTVALATERALATADYLFCTEVIKANVETMDEVLYGLITNTDNRVLIHSDRSQQGKTLDSRAFAQSQGPASDGKDLAVKGWVGEIEHAGERIIEAGYPLSFADGRLGMVRFGISLETLRAEVAASERHTRQQLVGGVLVTVVASLLVLLLAVFSGLLIAAHIVRPIDTLLAGVHRIRDGHLEHRVQAGGSAELITLGGAFNEMTAAVQDRDEQLRQRMQELAEALRLAEEANLLKEEKLRMEHELQTAAAVQAALFPKSSLDVGNINAAGVVHSATETGGDWYGFMRGAHGSVFLLIGDVTGHGTPAALVTAAACAAAQTLEQLSLAEGREPSPAEILRYINSVVYATGYPDYHMTFFVMKISPDPPTALFANAGHNFPLLLRTDGSTTSLMARGEVLGKKPEYAAHEHGVEMAADELVFLFTDGLVENANAKGKPWLNERRLARYLQNKRGLQPKRLISIMKEEMEAHFSGCALDDDITMVACKVGGT